MGRGVIVEHQGEGLYRVRLELHRNRVDARIAQLVAELEKIDTLEILLAEVAVLDAQVVVDDRKDAVNDAIDAGAEHDVLAALVQVVAEAAAERDRAQVTLLRLRSNKISLEKEKAALGKMPADLTVDAWCSDLTEDLEVNSPVGTVEIPGERQGAIPVLIRPGYVDPAKDMAGAEWVGARDGQLQPTIAAIGGHWSVFLNQALLPGWQKWKPTYRLGTITAIYPDDLADVTLDAAHAGQAIAGALDVNQSETLESVPVAYMDCDSAAFQIDDRVVVEFQEQDWTKPRVIGFESEPRSCRVLYMESGVVDARYVGDPASYQPKATLYPPAGGVQGKVTFAGGELKTIPVGGASHALPGGFTDKRLLRPGYPTKMTGKARLWLQALIGRADPRWEVPPESDPENPGGQSPTNLSTLATSIYLLSAGTLSGDHTVDYGVGLISDVDYTYFVLEIRGGEVICHTTILGEDGQKVRDYLLESGTGGETGRQIESYMISDLMLGPSGPILNQFTLRPPGLPFFHGWHFNRDGSAADMITMEQIYSTAEGPQRVVVNRMRHVRLSIVRSGWNPEQPISQANSPLSISLSVVETRDITPRPGLDPVWRPNLVSNEMGVTPWTGQGGYEAELPSADGPIYCFYDAADELQIVRYQGTFSEEMQTGGYSIGGISVSASSHSTEVPGGSDATIGSAIVIIPFHSPSAVYIGSMEARTLFRNDGESNQYLRSATATLHLAHAHGQEFNISSLGYSFSGGIADQSDIDAQAIDAESRWSALMQPTVLGPEANAVYSEPIRVLTSDGGITVYFRDPDFQDISQNYVATGGEFPVQELLWLGMFVGWA